MEKKDWFYHIVEKRIELSNDFQQYWELYSNINSWQFWFNAIMLILPLIALYFLIDRKRVFEIGFYGFAIHSIAIYLDTYGLKEGLWGYPYQLSVKLAANLALDSSFIPIVFMLIYQYTFHRPVIFYSLTLIGIIIFSFVIKPLLAYFDLFWISQEMTYTKLFFVYFVGIASAIIITKAFHKLSKQSVE